jgi:hypothetical protein
MALYFSTTTDIEYSIVITCDKALDMSFEEMTSYLQGDLDRLKIKEGQTPTYFKIKPLSPSDREDIEVKAGAYTRSELGRMLYIEQPDDPKEKAYWHDKLSDEERSTLAQYQAYLNRVYVETAKKAVVKIEGYEGKAWDAIQSIKPDNHRIQTIAEIIAHVQRISLLGPEGK